MNIGTNLKYLRKKYNLSQKDLTKIVDVNPPTISLWETGANQPTTTTLEVISNHFNVSIDLLVNGNLEEFDEKTFYDVNDFGYESRLVFEEINKKSRDNLLRSLYQFAIEENRNNRLPNSFSDRQMVAMLLESEDIILREFANYLQRFLNQYETLHISETKELLLDIMDYLSKGKDKSNEFLTLKRNVIELLFPLINFQFAQNQNNLTINTISQQFRLDSQFVLLVFEYYVRVKGVVFLYKDLKVDLQNIAIKDSNEAVYDIKISLTNTN